MSPLKAMSKKYSLVLKWEMGPLRTSVDFWGCALKEIANACFFLILSFYPWLVIQTVRLGHTLGHTSLAGTSIGNSN